MAVLRRALYDGDRELRRTCRRFGEEFRLLRLRAGATQAAVARAIGVDRSVICRIEHGDASVSNEIRARAAAALGADFRLQIYAERGPLIFDAAQAPVVERLLALRHSSWRPTVEAVIPGPGRRSVDVQLEGSDEIVLLEVESRVGRLEEIARELHAKRDDVAAARPGWRVHVALVLPPTRHHTTLVRDHPETIRAAFPIPSANLRAALEQGGDWPGDGILWLAGGRDRARSEPTTARLSLSAGASGRLR